jgi:hypothetical protein
LLNWGDWRGAVHWTAEYVDENDYVLIYSGFIESKNEEWLTDPVKASYLSAPFSFYQEHTPVLPLPCFPREPPGSVFMQTIKEQLITCDEVFAVCTIHVFPRAKTVEEKTSVGMVIASMRSIGFVLEERKDFFSVSVLKFSRGTPSRPSLQPSAVTR